MAAKNDTPSEGNIVGHMSPATVPGVEGEDVADPSTDSREAGDSPERKISKQSSPVVAPAIKSKWYMVAKVSTPTLRPLHDHVHKRVILDAVLELNRDDPITSFTNGLSVLINNTKMVNKYFTIYLVKEGGSKMWCSARDIPNNMTAVCLHINFSSNNVRMFEKQRNGDGQKKKRTNTSNVVYFSFVIACNVEPVTLIGCVGIEWTRTGGSRLMLKALLGGPVLKSEKKILQMPFLELYQVYIYYMTSHVQFS
jgi:hypothetical protein